MQTPFLPLLRELALCYQAFEASTTRHIRDMGLTAPQFDIIATLGNTSGMTPKELGEKTLITKGTLTGIIDRLEIKKLVSRCAHAHDGRCQTVQLTDAGVALFNTVFPAHLAYLRKIFSGFKARDYATIEAALVQLRGAFPPGSAAN